MLGAVSADSFSTIHSYTNTYHMPFFSPWFPEKVPVPTSGLMDYALSLRPEYHQAILDVIAYYGWKNIIYIYDSHDGKIQSTSSLSILSSLFNIPRAAAALGCVKEGRGPKGEQHHQFSVCLPFSAYFSL